MSPREYTPLLAAALAVVALSAGATTFDAVRGLDGASPPDDTGVDPSVDPAKGPPAGAPDAAPQADDDAGGGDGRVDETDSDGTGSAPVAIAVVGGGLLAAAALLRRLAAGDGDGVAPVDDGEESDPAPASAGGPPAADPENGVAAAWLALARRVAGDDWHRRTPGEVAAAAREAGLPPDAVADLRGLFERVRYGDAGPTPEREARADAAVDRLPDRETGEP